jgi:hypothetical protein
LSARSPTPTENDASDLGLARRSWTRFREEQNASLRFPES